MSPETGRERNVPHRYTFVIVPDAKAEKTRTLSVSRWGLIGAALGLMIFFSAVLLALIVYTPLGERLPLSTSRLEAQYARQIGEIQAQIRVLLDGINNLRAYNLRLRRAMGEQISSRDSLALVTLAEKRAEVSGPDQSGGTDGYPPGDKAYANGGRRYETFTGRPAASSTAGRTVQTIRFPLSQPVDGFVTRGFNGGNEHFGIDFAGAVKSPVTAAADGIVVFAEWTADDGFVMILAHSGGYLTVYKHNASLLRITGDPVRRGEVIALLGSTGSTSTGPHLHFEVWHDGVAEDPGHYLLTTQ